MAVRKRRTEPDSFGTYLQSVQREQSPEDAQLSLLLNVLAKSGPQPMSKLKAITGMSMSQFLDVLRKVTELNLVTITKGSEAKGEEDKVALTVSGTKMAGAQ